MPPSYQWIKKPLTMVSTITGSYPRVVTRLNWTTGGHLRTSLWKAVDDDDADDDLLNAWPFAHKSLPLQMGGATHPSRRLLTDRWSFWNNLLENTSYWLVIKKIQHGLTANFNHRDMHPPKGGNRCCPNHSGHDLIFSTTSYVHYINNWHMVRIAHDHLRSSPIHEPNKWSFHCWSSNGTWWW